MEAVRHAKYHRQLWRLRALADIVRPSIERGFDEASNERSRTARVAAIPMHRASLRERGFNVSAILARQLFGSLEVEVVVDALAKPDPTQPQAELPRGERLENLRGVFEPRRPGAIEGHPWIVVDDVTTTGATIREAARALREAGASSVVAVTLARTVPDRR